MQQEGIHVGVHNSWFEKTKLQLCGEWSIVNGEKTPASYCTIELLQLKSATQGS